ncbi:hypothetical protein ACFRFL_41330 [Streptomyces sp. NPDC056708]|uniref:hypothetical protein n=1 Tax=unclassified Streptomyces TaxID=2593676 RepID=UPI0036C44235
MAVRHEDTAGPAHVTTVATPHGSAAQGAAGSALTAVELLTPCRAAALTGASESGVVLFAALACAGFICSGIGSHLAPPATRPAGSGGRAVSVSLGTSASGLLLLGATTASTGLGSIVLAAKSSVPADVRSRPAEHPEPSVRCGVAASVPDEPPGLPAPVGGRSGSLREAVSRDERPAAARSC